MSRAARPAGPGRWPAGLAWVLWVLCALGLVAVFWLDYLLRRAGRSELALRAHEVPYVLMVVGIATVGAVLAGRRPRHPVGWLMLALGLSATIDVLTDNYARYGLLASPGAVPAVSHIRAFGDTFALWPACIGFILLLTPTGSLPSPRWRWWARIAAVAPVLWQAAVVVGNATVQYPPLLLVPEPVFCSLLGEPGHGRRATHAHDHAAQRAGWRCLAGRALPPSIESAAVVLAAVLGSAVVLCLTIAAAVLRYRLYDLDRVISRTIAYGLLTVLLGGGYAAVVLSLGQLLGQNSSLVVAGATLAVAAVFQPARRRVQELVDRRFNRRRYDAVQTIVAFSARLQDKVDLDTLSAELAVTDQTRQPTQVSLWLRPALSASQGPSSRPAMCPGLVS